MKKLISKKGFRNIAILLVLMVTGSCLDYTVTTSVNRDGSVIRKYKVRGDSAEIFKGSLMIPSGPEWKISHSLEPKDKDDSLSEKSQYIYEASRTFDSVNELMDWLESDTSRGTIKPVVSLKRKFRWFYTYYEYSEVYPMVFPFQKIPVDSFLTDLEQSVIMDDDRTAYSAEAKKLAWKIKDMKYNYTPADSMEMNKIKEKCEQKFMKWLNASIIEEYLHVLNKNFRDEAVVQDLVRKKEEWRNAGAQSLDFGGESDFTSVSHLNAVGDSLTGMDRLQELYAGNPEVFAEFNRKIKETEDFGIDDSYMHVLALPGDVYSTNSEKVGLTEMEWHLEKMYFFMKDYEMKASSRAANPWIMVLSGLLAAGLIGVLFMRRK